MQKVKMSKNNDHNCRAQCVHCNNWGTLWFITLDHQKGCDSLRRTFWIYKCDTCKKEFVEIDIVQQLTRSGTRPCPTYWKNGAPILYDKVWLENRTKNYKKVKEVIFV